MNGRGRCVVCGQKSIAIAVRIDPSGNGLCAKDHRLHEDGYMALVEAANNGPRGGKAFYAPDVPTTGRVMHLRPERAQRVFGLLFPREQHGWLTERPVPVLFATREVFEYFVKMYEMTTKDFDFPEDAKSSRQEFFWA